MGVEKTPIVSVVVPVYNVEIYIAECLESIVGQTYTNLEIILVVDGSTDTSEEICRCYARKDHRIKLISQVNQGLSAARNTGISVASGDLLCFVDSDDFLDVRMIEIMVSNLEESDAQMVVCGMYKYYSEDKKVHLGINDKKLLSSKDVLKSILTEDLIGNYSCNKLVKRSLFVGIAYPIGKAFEDVLTIYKVVEKCERICVIPNTLYYYRQRESSLVREISRKAYCDQIEAFYFQTKDIRIHYPDLFQICEAQLLRLTLRLFDTGAAWNLLDTNILTELKREIDHLPPKSLKGLPIRACIEYFGLTMFPKGYAFVRRSIYLMLRWLRSVKG